MKNSFAHADMKLAAPVVGAVVALLIILQGTVFWITTEGRNVAVLIQGQSAARHFSRELEAVAQQARPMLAALPASEAPGVPFARAAVFSADRSLLGGDKALAEAMAPMIHAVPTASGYRTDLVWDGGRPNLAVAARRQDGGVTVALMPVDGGFLARFAAREGLTQASIIAAPPKLWLPDSALVGWQPIGTQGRPTGAVLTWSTRQIMNRIIAKPVPIMAALTFLMAGIGYAVYRRTRRLAQSLVASEEHAQHLSLHDPMTGLANRTLFANRLELALEQRRRSGGVTGVLAIDLDRFKQVNDSLGHAAGDELIREAARRLLTVCRTTDTVARLGGDELALVALLPTLAAVEALARRAVESLSGTIELPGGRAILSASIGVTVVDNETTDAPEAMRQADLALYRAKDQGRGRYSMFEQAMDESLRLRRQTETDLRHALEHGDIEVQYQPQFTARGGKLESVEALARWRHAERGMISPAYFIAIAEESGLIHELGEQVLRQACTDAARWPGLKVAVNVSPVQLRRADFAERCRVILQETGIQADRLELEITEGVLLDNDQRTQTTLHALREMGFKIALDDFGTGYSSLSYLNAYPVDKIKIDRSFISALGVQEDADKVVKAIVKLGKALGLQVTAEGVETQAQRTELVNAGCNILQGYLEARPADAGAIDTLLAQIKASKHAA